MSAPWNRLRRTTASWLRSVTGRRQLEAEMEDEVSFHLEVRAADLQRNGMGERDAMRQARLEFGAVATHKDGMRRSLGLRWWDELWDDLRYATRLLRKSPGFTMIAVGSLALAIGANTTIFSLANELLYERLGVPHAEELRLLTLNTSPDHRSIMSSTWGSDFTFPGGGRRHDSFTYPIYQQLRRENHVVGGIFAFKDSIQTNVTVDGLAQAVQLELVSGNFYEQMGTRPVLGRPLLDSDDQEPGTGAVATISDGFWQRSFARSPAVIGKVVTVNMSPVTIVGVNPPGFTGAKSVQNSPDIFMPLSMIPLLKPSTVPGGPLLTNSKLWWVQLMARAKPGIADAEAQASLQVLLLAGIRGTMTVATGDTMPRLQLENGSRGLSHFWTQYQFAKPLTVLLTLGGLVLLLACANIANLMLARAAGRQREIGVRLALGAGRSRILRQMLTESLLIAVVGGVLGVWLSYLGRSVLPRLLLNAWERNDLHVPFDWKVFSFTAGITLATGLLFGIAPAWAATRAEIGSTLKDGSKTLTRHRGNWSGRGLVAFQIALSTLLVIGAGLFLRTLINLSSIDPGFRTDHLVLFDIYPPSKQYPAPKDVGVHAQIEEALRALPGVDGVTVTDVSLLADSQSSSGFNVEGVSEGKNKGGELPNSMEANVGRDFLSVMGIPIIAGRGFTQQDVDSPRQVAVVDQALATKFFPNQNSIGKRFSMDDGSVKDRRWLHIVGVFRDIRYAHLKEEPVPLHLDLYRQATSIGGMTYIVRTGMTPKSIVPSLRAAVQRIDRDLPLMDVRTQQQQIYASMQQERMFASLTAGFGVLALALACVGIYGVMAYTVSQRTNEMGIRLALGARRDQVRVMVLRDAGWLAVMGVVVGLAAALMMGRLVKSLLYGMQPADPMAMLGSAALLLLVAIVAGWVPAMRASRLEPMVALRHE